MAKQVKGFLAADGTFFNEEPECQRYEYFKLVEQLCETHGTDFDNFMAVINAWQGQIKGYYDADERCKDRWTGKGPIILNDTTDRDTTADESFLRSEGYSADAAIGDKDAPGFLEQSLRKY